MVLFGGRRSDFYIRKGPSFGVQWLDVREISMEGFHRVVALLVNFMACRLADVLWMRLYKALVYLGAFHAADTVDDWSSEA